MLGARQKTKRQCGRLFEGSVGLLKNKNKIDIYWFL